MHDDKVLAAGQQVTSQAAPNISSQKSYARERVQSLIGSICFFSIVYFYPVPLDSHGTIRIQPPNVSSVQFYVCSTKACLFLQALYISIISSSLFLPGSSVIILKSVIDYKLILDFGLENIEREHLGQAMYWKYVKSDYFRHREKAQDGLVRSPCSTQVPLL